MAYITGIMAAARERIGDPGGTQVTDAEIYGYLNDGQMEVVQDEALDAALVSLTRLRSGVFVSATFDYDLPVDFLRERYVTLGGIVAVRMPLVEMDALRNNDYYAPSKAKPFYSIADGKLRFYTDGADPDSLTYQLYYVRKPMRVRAITDISAIGKATTPLNHLLAAGNSIYVEDVTWSGSGFSGATTVSMLGTAKEFYSTDFPAAQTGTGGRVIATSVGQIGQYDDPLVHPIFHGPIMDFAVSRCREQLGQFDEAARIRAHFIQRMEALKQRYGSGLPHDAIPGDPGRRQAAG